MMNPDNIAQLITVLLATGTALSPVVFWVLQRVVKPFVADNRFMPLIAIALGGLLGLVIPFILPAFGMETIPWVASMVAGMVGGGIAMKTYDEGVNEGIKKMEGEE